MASGWPMTSILPPKCLSDESLENFADLDPVKGHAEDDEVRLLRVQNRGQLAGLAAFAGDETEILKSVGKKGPKVLFAVGDAGPRHDLSTAEAGALRVLIWIEVIHTRPVR